MAALRRLVADPRALIALAGLHVALKLAMLPTALSAPLQGDEGTYNDGAKAFAHAVREVIVGRGLPLQTLSDHVVGNGWFMPGISVILAPLYVVDPDAGAQAVRLFMGVVTLVAFLASAWVLRRVLGPPYAAALLVCPGLLPMWVLYSYTSWGDAAAGIATVFVVALLVAQWRRLEAGRPASLRLGALLGLTLAVTLYMRSSALPAVAGLLALCAVAAVVVPRGRARRRSGVSWALSVACFVALVMPWSIAVSKVFDHRVTTTTTVPLSMAYAFGSRDDLCFGPCPRGIIWVEMMRYAATVESETGVNELVVQQQMAEYAMRDLTLSSYVRDVRGDFGRYVFQPTGYEPAFRTVPGVSPQTLVSKVAMRVTDVIYFAALALAAVAVLWVRRLPSAQQAAMLLVSLIGAALMTQPFVHVCTSRYWPVFAPMLGLAAASLLVRAEPAASNSWLWRLQIVTTAAWGMAVLALLLLGR